MTPQKRLGILLLVTLCNIIYYFRMADERIGLEAECTLPEEGETHVSASP